MQETQHVYILHAGTHWQQPPQSTVTRWYMYIQYTQVSRLSQLGYIQLCISTSVYVSHCITGLSHINPTCTCTYQWGPLVPRDPQNLSSQRRPQSVQKEREHKLASLLTDTSPSLPPHYMTPQPTHHVNSHTSSYIVMSTVHGSS